MMCVFIGAISKDIKNKQVLDKLQVERERGITVKAQTASIIYHYEGQVSRPASLIKYIILKLLYFTRQDTNYFYRKFCSYTEHPHFFSLH